MWESVVELKKEKLICIMINRCNEAFPKVSSNGAVYSCVDICMDVSAKLGMRDWGLHHRVTSVCTGTICLFWEDL